MPSIGNAIEQHPLVPPLGAVLLGFNSGGHRVDPQALGHIRPGLCSLKVSHRKCQARPQKVRRQFAHSLQPSRASRPRQKCMRNGPRDTRAGRSAPLRCLTSKAALAGARTRSLSSPPPPPGGHLRSRQYRQRAFLYWFTVAGPTRPFLRAILTAFLVRISRAALIRERHPSQSCLSMRATRINSGSAERLAVPAWRCHSVSPRPDPPVAARLRVLCPM